MDEYTSENDVYPTKVEPSIPLGDEEWARSLAAERARAAAAEEGRRHAERIAERQARLQGVTTALAESLTPGQVSRAVLDQGTQALEARTGAIFLLRGDDQLEMTAATGYPESLLERGRQLMKEGSPPFKDSLRSGEPRWIGSREELFARYPTLARLGTDTLCQSWAILPLCIGGSPVGLIVFGFLQPHNRFVEEERAFAIALAAQCSQALDRARLYQAEREARLAAETAREKSRKLARRAQALAEASRAFAEAGLELQAAFEAVTRYVAECLGDTCLLTLPAGDGLHLRIAAWFHRNPEARAAIARIAARPVRTDAGFAGRVFLSGKPALVPRVEPQGHDQTEESRSYVERFGLHSLLIVPLRLKGQTIGTLGISRDDPAAPPYDEDDCTFLQDVADRAALAIENARLYEMERRTADRLARLQRVTAALSGALTPEEASEVIVREGTQALGAVVGMVALLDASGAELRFARVTGVEPETLKPWQPLPLGRHTPISDAARTREPVFIESIEEWVRRYPEAIQARVGPGGARAAVPLMVGEKVFGALGFSFAGDRRFGEEDRAFIISLARQCASALERALLFKQTRDAVRLRDDFLSIAGHELKTPLTALKLQLQGVGHALKGGDLPRLAERMAKTEGHVSRLAKLISELLDVSRITAGRLALELEPTDLAEVVREVCARFSDEARRMGSEVMVRGEEPIVGRWDRLRLDQVATNLISNALKYGAGKPVEVSVELQGEVARLEVRDHGIGIEPEHQARIFGRFERAVSERNYGGFGLGLWIVRQLLQALGGTIRLESQPGVGSTFIVELPLAGPGAEPPATPAGERTAQEGDSSSSNGSSTSSSPGSSTGSSPAASGGTSGGTTYH